MSVKMAQFNMPLHMQGPENQFIMEDHYHSNGMTGPHDLGPWIDDQSDGGGKFRLKRRRRCGQCGPCQVKDNCGKCQYCMRKDVLKQACIYRKCVYLRKPVPRFRTEASSSSSGVGVGSGSGGSAGVGGVVGGSGVTGGGTNGNSSSTAVTRSSIQSTPSTLSSMVSNTSSQPAVSSYNPPSSSTVSISSTSSSSASSSIVTATAPATELSSCQLVQNPFGLTVNNGMVDPLRTSALDQHRTAMLDAASMMDSTRNPCLSGSRTLESGRSPALDLGRNTNTADSGFGTGSSMTTSPASSVTKDRPSVPPAPMPPVPAMPPAPPVPPREQYHPPVDQWGPMPYGFPRSNPWAHPAFQANPAAAYGFQPSMNHYTNPYASSCRLGMQDPASHLTTPAQPAFHHSMPFARPEFPTHANFRPTAPSMPPTMTPPFYPPPPHIPSSLPNFPSFSQLPSSAGPHPTYAPMYPGNFYSSFRPPTESQIYHAHLPPPCSPFSQPGQLSSVFPSFSQKRPSVDKADKSGSYEKYEEDLKEKYSVFHVHNSQQVCDSDAGDFLTKSATEYCFVRKGGTKLASLEENDSTSMLLKTVPGVCIDEDLQQQIRRISGRGECSVICINDFKMQAFIRSDDFNHLEIEVDSPTLEAVFREARGLPRPVEESDPSAELEDHGGVGVNTCNSDSNESHAHCDRTALSPPVEDGPECDVVEPSPSHQMQNLTRFPFQGGEQDSEVSSPNWVTSHSEVKVRQTGNLTEDSHHRSSEQDHEHTLRSLSDDVTVCLMQEGEEGVTEVEVPGTQVQLQDVDLDDNLISISSDPPDLLRFITETVVVPASPDVILRFEFDREAPSDLSPEELSWSSLELLAWGCAWQETMKWHCACIWTSQINQGSHSYNVQNYFLACSTL